MVSGGLTFVEGTGKTITLRIMDGSTDVTSNANTNIYIKKCTTDYDYKKTPEQNVTFESSPSGSTISNPESGYYVIKATYESGAPTVTKTSYLILHVGAADDK